MTRAGASLVPLDIHFNARGVAKVTIGLGQGRKKKTSDMQSLSATGNVIRLA